MNGKFVRTTDQTREQLEWGELGWITRPSTVGCSYLTVIEVILYPGKGHEFHMHPDQEETITVVSGQIEQWLEGEMQILGPGDTIYIAAGVVHASFGYGDESAKLLVALSPCVGEDGYEVVEVADQAPWNTLRQ